MPVPLKNNIDNLPNNYKLARKRANGLRKHMLRRPDLQLALDNPILKLKKNKFIILPDKFNADSISVTVRDPRIELIANSCKEPKATLTRLYQTCTL